MFNSWVLQVLKFWAWLDYSNIIFCVVFEWNLIKIPTFGNNKCTLPGYTEGLRTSGPPQINIYKKSSFFCTTAKPHPLTLFKVLRTCCKPRKSKDWKILHRNYTPKIFSTPKKNIFFSHRKIYFLKISKILKTQNFQENIFSDFDNNFFNTIFLRIFV